MGRERNSTHGTNHSKGVPILFNPRLDVRIGNSEAEKTEDIYY